MGPSLRWWRHASFTSLWSSKRANGITEYNGAFNSVAVALAVALADMDGDGTSEVIAPAKRQDPLVVRVGF